MAVSIRSSLRFHLDVGQLDSLRIRAAGVRWLTIDAGDSGNDLANSQHSTTQTRGNSCDEQTIVAELLNFDSEDTFQRIVPCVRTGHGLFVAAPAGLQSSAVKIPGNGEGHSIADLPRKVEAVAAQLNVFRGFMPRERDLASLSAANHHRSKRCVTRIDLQLQRDARIIIDRDGLAVSSIIRSRYR